MWQVAHEARRTSLIICSSSVRGIDCLIDGPGMCFEAHKLLGTDGIFTRISAEQRERAHPEVPEGLLLRKADVLPAA